MGVQMNEKIQQAIQRLDAYNAAADDGSLYASGTAKVAVECVRLADSLEAVLRHVGAFDAAPGPVRCNIPGLGKFCQRDAPHIGPHSWQYLEPLPAWTEERIQARQHSADPNPQADDRAVQPHYNGGDL